MHNRILAVLPLLLVLALPLAVVRNARAIPAFTRQYKTECSTCHTIYPELNEYGQAFQKNGYVYSARQGSEKVAETSGKGEGAAQPQVEKERKNEGILLAGIPEWLPLSVTANQNIVYNEHAPSGDNWDFATRDVVLQAGGAFRDLAGFFMTYDLYNHASNSSNQNDSNKLDELFMVWRRLFHTPVNIKFGKFEPKLSLWKKSDKIIITSFATSAFKAGSSPFSMDTSQDALEANCILADRLFLATGIVDVDGQNTKDAYGHMSVKFGGTDFHGNEPTMDLENESIWDYLTLTMAAYGYAGRTPDPFGSSLKNNFYRVGGDMDILYKRLRVRLSGVTGRETNPDFMTVAAQKRPLVLASEAEYLFGSPATVAGVFRYEYQDDGSGIIRRYIPAVAYTPLQNVKLLLQYNYERTPLTDNKIALMNVSFGF